MQDEFATFCHIGQYGENGYRALPRMLSMSQPLNLWAPSSAYLKAPFTRIPPADFIRYVEEGYIRIFGREKWLLDQAWRTDDRFPEAAWDAGIDGQLKKFCEEDAAKPIRERRVVVAPPEKGWDWAEQYLAANQGQVKHWNRLARSRAGSRVIPSAIRAAALGYGDDSFRVAQRILRDAHNHGRALAESGAQAPFFLSAVDKQFLSVLAEAPNDDDQSTIGEPARASVDTMAADLAAQLVELLRDLDRLSTGYRDSGRLDKFIRGPGHRELVRWIGSICAMLRHTDPRTVDDVILTQLANDVSGRRIVGPVRDVLNHRDEAFVSLVGFAVMVAGLFVDPIGAATAIGAMAQVYPLGKGLGRQLGFAPAHFSGAQWPFLYTYGRRADRKSVQQLEYVLSEVRADPRRAGGYSRK